MDTAHWRARVAARLAQHPGWMAHALAGMDGAELAAELGCSELGVWRLLLCKLPRAERWDADIAELAGFARADAGALDALLRRRTPADGETMGGKGR